MKHCFTSQDSFSCKKSKTQIKPAGKKRERERKFICLAPVIEMSLGKG